MTAHNPPIPPRRDATELLEIWAANLEAHDVTLAPFMPARLGALAPEDAAADRLRELIARAQGRRQTIIL
jgi:hypothetical protein